MLAAASGSNRLQRGAAKAAVALGPITLASAARVAITLQTLALSLTRHLDRLLL
jgi:hypothetical protein